MKLLLILPPIKYKSLFFKYILNNNAFSKLQSLILDIFLVHISIIFYSAKQTLNGCHELYNTIKDINFILKITLYRQSIAITN